MLSEEANQKLCKAAKDALEEAFGHPCPDCIIEVHEGPSVAPAVWEVRAWADKEDYEAGEDPNVSMRGTPA